MSSNAHGTTLRVAEYVARIAYGDLPLEVVRKAKLHILDSLGAMVMGNPMEIGRAIVQFGKGGVSRPESSVIGADYKTDAVTAALVNGTLCHADEVDDTNYAIPMHLGCASVPAALAVGEREAASGAEFVNAVVLGYDIAARLVASLDLVESRRRGHTQMGIGACFGSVAVACKLLRLDAQCVISALGMAGQQASGTYAFFHEPRHMAKALEFGIGARNGVTAALLAQLGIQGAPEVFEGPGNVLSAFAGEKSEPQRMTERLGDYHHVSDAHIKKYPVGMPIQAPLEALSQLIERHRINASRIVRITVRMAESMAWVVRNRAIENISIETVLAKAACANDKEAAARFKERIAIVGDESQKNVRLATVEIETADGEKRAMTLEAKDIPFPPEAIEEKFLGLASPVLGADQSNHVVECVRSLDQLPDIRQLGDLLRR
jgi:2-methylcitrate dehydratase PrpD